MPLEAAAILLSRALRGGYALGYFESWDLASLQGVLDAAEQTRSPTIIGFNGEFLVAAGRAADERLDLYAALGRAAAESARVPCALIFNECSYDSWTRAAIALGFNLVMPVAGSSAASYPRRVAALARLAHERGAAVEAEVGELPCGGTGAGGEPTDPEAAAAFVAETGIDLLAVSVGNVHIRLEGRGPLDLERIEAIRRRVPVPLALHGGTGIERDALQEAIRLGVAKVNYGTYLKQRYLAAMRRALDSEVNDPHRLLGIGGPEDLLVAGRAAVRDAVLERIEWLGCCGRA